MLTVQVKTAENYNEETEEFVTEEYQLDLEHSLVSLSKWESKYEKPFLDNSERTPEEIMDYIKSMAISESVPDAVFESLSTENFARINEYIAAKQTATWFNDDGEKNNQKAAEKITSELVYYWMISYNIPMECEHWHLNRLFTLIRVFNVKNSKPKKMSAGERARRNRELNEKRKQQLKTKG